MKIKFYPQLENTDCGPACLQMVLHHYKKDFSLFELRDKCNVTRAGITMKDISNGATKAGLSNMIGKIKMEELQEMPMPCILHWNQKHFVVLYDIEVSNQKKTYCIADPGFGKLKMKEPDFEVQWKNEEDMGIAIFFEEAEDFNSIIPEKHNDNQLVRSWQFVKKHVTRQRKKLWALAALLGISVAISWVFPVLLKNLIDKGVNPKNLHVVWLILISQVALFSGQIIINWARSIISAHFSTKLSISIISDFIRKLIKLPIKFFDTRLYTDILQKLDDHAHIESFVTHMLLQFVFSFITFLFLSCLLAYYNVMLFLIVFGLSVLSILWILLFLKQRKLIDYERFRLNSDNKNILFETIVGMPEVKINNAQNTRFAIISNFQQKVYKLNIKSTNLFQMQQVGVQSLSQLKSIITTFLCAYWVINDQMTMGKLLGISYIVGQMTGPLDSFVNFFRSAQDAKIAFNRLDEIQRKEDENGIDKVPPPENIQSGIHLNTISFRYEGSMNPFVIKNISAIFPAGKTTAIVGASGSGKTTLLKLLLSFYPPFEGSITLDNINLAQVNSDSWRDRCGVVLQDGYIFSGTIAENIAIADQNPDMDRLISVTKTACIYDYISTLPLGFTTKIGKAGSDLSGGQKQRILIARAIYKNPHFLFLDEATSSLDASNEKDIMENMAGVFQNKTVVIIAHRLSTVKNADQIIVMQDGELVEQGNHESLTNLRGYYYNLVKNQLELGK
jgi:ATP-binding cassette, subfamily B, bacterial